MAEARLRVITVIAWAVLAVCAALFTVSGLTQPGVDRQEWLLETLLWTLIITGVSLITVPAPSGTRLSLGIGAIVSASILMTDIAAFAAAVSGALAISWIIKTQIGAFRNRTDTDFLGDSLAAGAYSVTYVIAHELVVDAELVDPTWSIVISVAIGGVAWFVVRALVSAFVGVERTDLAGRYLWLLSLEDWGVVISMFAAGTLFGLTWPEMGGWALAVSVLPYAFGHLAFERYHSTRITYRQTIRALAQIPEVAGLAPIGHSTRTSDLSVAIAQELGLHPNDVIELEYAALMHDVGRITLNEPAILKAGYTDEDIARWGAQIIAEAPYLENVSTLVEAQHRPYRSPGIESDPDVPMASKIIKVCSAYDQGHVELELSPIESLERIHQGSAYEFDPVVAAS
ncbi:MAG: HD domain-containing protein, partial [Acidimicrobiia bacterium]|nr:HD domain-containing protein [Acidimicrobiia bacterium]